MPTLVTETIARAIKRSQNVESGVKMLSQSCMKGGANPYNRGVNKCVFS